MSKMNVSISGDSEIFLFHEKESNQDEIMSLAVEEIFGDLDIHKRIDDGEAKIAIWARLDITELALLIESVVKYTEAKLKQFGE